MSRWPVSAQLHQRTAWPWILFAVFTCLDITGAENFRTVRGTVRDQNGNVLPGAVVELKDRTTLQVRSYRTQQDGAYHFGILFPDLTYHLRANYAGVFSHSKPLSRFSSREAKTIDFVIDLRKTRQLAFGGSANR